MKRSPVVVGRDIEIGLRRLGLRTGDLVFVHSSLSSFGCVEGGAETVVEAILAVIGPGGTLGVPTFNYEPGCFDPVETPSVVGAITEAVRLRPDAVRSLHPTHSVAAIGKRAREFVAGHESVHYIGEGSPLHKLYLWDGKVLLLGVDHRTTSIIHLAEHLARVPYLNRNRQVMVRTEQGIIRRGVRRGGCSRGFVKIEEDLAASGERAGTSDCIGKCLARLIPARTIVDVAVEMLSRDPAALLCDDPQCSVCAESRAMIAARSRGPARMDAEFGSVIVDWGRRTAEFLGDADAPVLEEGAAAIHLKRVMAEAERMEDPAYGEDHKN